MQMVQSAALKIKTVQCQHFVQAQHQLFVQLLPQVVLLLAAVQVLLQVVVLHPVLLPQVEDLVVTVLAVQSSVSQVKFQTVQHQIHSLTALVTH